MTAHEIYAALFWLVAGSYLIYLGWTLYRVVVERIARSRHPSSLPHGVGEMARYETEGAFCSGHEVGEKPESSAGPGSLVEFLFD